MDSSSADRDPIEVLAENFVERRRQGESPTVDEYAEKYPQLAAEIREVFPALVLMEQADPDTTSVTAASADTMADTRTRKESVGDYRIVRQIGRGGMGVVYEAEQVSLGRRVALKLLPESLSKDDKALDRFRREARAAARLHHTNIVPVFEIGQDRDTVFYAMQFIQGQNLDDVLTEIRRLRDGLEPSVGGEQPGNAAHTAALSLCRGQIVGGGPGNAVSGDLLSASATMIHSKGGFEDTSPTNELPPRETPCLSLPDDYDHSSVDFRQRSYFRSIASLGEKVADALSYAHARGIIHRDIKPSNLLLDAAGVIWVSDFGLAKFEDDAHTRTGDIVGTMRYMSPERFKGGCDTNADVYSLGATLYEMLALRPAFESTDQLKLIDRISNVSPPRLRSLNPLVPLDLETIVLKAMEKDPSHRYHSAGEMAEDLRRFVEDEPIRARQISSVERFARWTRRNRVVAALATSLFAVAIATAVVTSALAIDLRRVNSDLTQRIDTERELRMEADRLKAVADERRRAVELANAQLRRQVYLADLRSVQQAYRDGNVLVARQLLTRHIPAKGEEDLRAWEWYYWWRQCHRHQLPIEIDVSDKNPWGFACIAESPDKQSVAVGYANGRIMIIDAKKKKALRCLQAPSKEQFTSVVFLRQGALLAACCREKQIHLWETAGWKHQLGPDTSGDCIALTTVTRGDGSEVLAAGTRQGTIQIFETKTWRETKSLKCSQPIKCLAFSNDARTLAAGQTIVNRQSNEGGSQCCLTVWNADSWMEQPLNRPLDVSVLSLAYSPDGKWLALGTVDRSVRLWDVDRWEEIDSLDCVTPPQSLAFSADNRFLAASTSKDNAIRIWETESRKMVNTLKGHYGIVMAIGFLGDSQWLLSAAMDFKGLRLWDVESLTTTDAVRGDFKKIGFSRDGHTLVAVSSNGGVSAFDAPTGEVSENWNDCDKYVDAAFSDSVPGVMALVSADSVGVFDADSGNLSTHDLPGFGSSAHARIAIGSGGHRLIWGRRTPDEYVVTVIDAKTGKQLEIDTGSPGVPSCVALSPDHQFLSMAGIIWNLNTKTLVADRGWRSAGAVAFSPDGKVVAIGGWPNVINLFETRNFERINTLRGHSGYVTSFAFSRDGTQLVSGAMDDTVRVWDVPAGELKTTLTGHEGSIRDVAISPNGNLIASCSEDGTIRFWQVATRMDVERNLDEPRLFGDDKRNR